MKKFRKPYRLKKKRSILKSRFFWFAISILIISGGIFYFLFFSSFFQIKEVKISGHETIQEEELKEVIQKQISHSFFKDRLRSKSILLANFKKMNEELLKIFPQIALINFKKNFPDTLIVKIEERKPVAVFLQDERSFFIDREGIVFKLLESNNFNQELLKIQDLTLERDFSLGENIIDKEKLTQILTLTSNLKENLKILSKEILIVSEERLNLKTSEGWEIYFNPKKDLNWQITKLDLVLKERIPPERRGSLKYVDLRFEKVYILFNSKQEGF